MGYNNHNGNGYQSSIQAVEGLRDYIANGRNKITRPLANNTVARLINGGQDVAIRLHSTDIITYNSNGTITLDSGGWRSATTKQRINEYTHAGLYQKSGIWYMSDNSLYYDGVAIKFDGTVIAPRKSEKYEQQVKKIKAKAKKYAHDYVIALKAGKVDMPSSGDCWACLGMVGTGDVQHINDHISEKYYVPTLLVNAGRAAGYRDDQIGLMGIGGRQLFIDPERNIYKFVVKQLQGAL